MGACSVDGPTGPTIESAEEVAGRFADAGTGVEAAAFRRPRPIGVAGTRGASAARLKKSPNPLHSPDLLCLPQVTDRRFHARPPIFVKSTQTLAGKLKDSSPVRLFYPSPDTKHRRQDGQIPLSIGTTRSSQPRHSTIWKGAHEPSALPSIPPTAEPVSRPGIEVLASPARGGHGLWGGRGVRSRKYQQTTANTKQITTPVTCVTIFSPLGGSYIPRPPSLGRGTKRFSSITQAAKKRPVLIGAPRIVGSSDEWGLPMKGNFPAAHAALLSNSKLQPANSNGSLPSVHIYPRWPGPDVS